MGQALAAIESSDLGRAKADFLAARVAAQIARETADREKGLFEARVSSRRDWEQAEAIANQARAESGAAELRLHTLGVGDAALARLRPEDHYAAFVTLTAPIAGVVVARAATLGQMVTPSDTLFEIMDLSQIWVVVDVYERDIHQVHVGQAVTVTVAAMANKPRVGTIADVGAVLDPATRAVHVRVVLANPDGQLRPGMFATVEIASTKAEPREGLYVPTTAVVRGQRDTWSVFVPRGPLTFERRKVELGGASGDWTEVTRGLTDADAIVTRGAFALKSELEKSADEDE